MNRIRKAVINDAPLLVNLAVETLMESHGHSAPAEDMNAYVQEKYSAEILRAELEKPANNYYLFGEAGTAVGFSNIIFNSPCPGREEPNLALLDRIYLLQQVHSRGFGKELFQFNAELARANKQAGIWLHVWVENTRAVRFYERMGFVVIGSHNFRVSATHSNPNHRLLLLF